MNSASRERKRPVLRSIGLFATLLGGCAETPVADNEEITFSDSWFSCDSRFQCIVVQDSYCNLAAVNRAYTIIYQDWSRQQADQAGVRVPCQRLDPNLPAPVARCSSGRCVYPLGRTSEKQD